MNKKYLTVGLLILLALLLVGCVAKNLKNKMVSNQNKETTTTTNTPTTPTVATSESFTGKISDLFNLGKTVHCTYSTDTTKGDIFVANKKMGGVFTVTSSDGKEMSSNVVSDGEWMYLWSSSMPNGIKMNVSDVTKSDTTNSNTSATAALNSSNNYKCDPWLLDETKFAVPTNMTFTDASSMMKGSNGNACSACDQINDPEAKQSCKTNLHC